MYIYIYMSIYFTMCSSGCLADPMLEDGISMYRIVMDHSDHASIARLWMDAETPMILVTIFYNHLWKGGVTDVYKEQYSLCFYDTRSWFRHHMILTHSLMSLMHYSPGNSVDLMDHLICNLVTSWLQLNIFVQVCRGLMPHIHGTSCWFYCLEQVMHWSCLAWTGSTYLSVQVY